MIFSKDTLARLRKERGYSLGMISRLLSTRYGLKISRQAVSQWENGKTCPRFKSLSALARLLAVEPGVFFKEISNNQFVSADGKED